MPKYSNIVSMYIIDTIAAAAAIATTTTAVAIATTTTATSTTATAAGAAADSVDDNRESRKNFFHCII